MKCERCNGTGYQSAAKEAGMENAPFMLRPIGIWQCEYCGGTGKKYDPAENLKRFKEEHPEEYEKFNRKMRVLLRELERGLEWRKGK